MSPSHPLHPSLKKAVNSSLQFNLPPASHAESKVQRSFRATGSVYGPNGNSRVVIEIPKIDSVCVNGNSSFLCGTMKCVGTNVMYSNSLSSWIKRLIIRGADNTILEDISGYNVLHRCISDLTCPKDQQDNILSLQAGYGDDDDRKLYAVGKSFNLMLMSSFFRNSNLIPLAAVAPLVIEIECEEDANVLQTSDGTPGTYAISDLRMSLELVSFSDAINSAIMSAYKQNKISLHCPTYENHTLSSFAQNEVFAIPNRSKSLKQLLLIIRPQSNLRNFSRDSLGERTIGSLASISVQIGGQVIDALTTESDLWTTTCRAFEWQVTGTINQRNYSKKFGGTGTSFLVAFDLSNDESSGWVSGNSSQATVEVKLVHSSPISPEIYVYDAWLLCDRLISFQTSGPVITQ